jgi:phosphatidylglycerophosphate synthase
MSSPTDAAGRAPVASAGARYRIALARLSAAQKSGAGVPAYLRWPNRALGRRAAAAASIVGASANSLTAVGVACTAAGLVILIFLSASPWAAALGTVVLLCGYALDSADGQLARLLGTGSVAGEWLDHVVDAVRIPATHVAVAVALTVRAAPVWMIWVAIAFAVTASAWFFAQILAEKLSARVGAAPPSESPRWVSFAKLPLDNGSLIVVLVTLPWLPVFAALYTLLFVVNLVVAGGSFRRKYRALKGQRV